MLLFILLLIVIMCVVIYQLFFSSTQTQKARWCRKKKKKKLLTKFDKHYLCTPHTYHIASLWNNENLFFDCNVSFVSYGLNEKLLNEYIYLAFSFLSFLFFFIYCLRLCLLLFCQQSIVSNNDKIREWVRWPRIRWRAWVHAQVVVVFVSIETNDAKNGTHTVHDGDEKAK